MKIQNSFSNCPKIARNILGKIIFSDVNLFLDEKDYTLNNDFSKSGLEQKILSFEYIEEAKLKEIFSKLYVFEEKEALRLYCNVKDYERADYTKFREIIIAAKDIKWIPDDDFDEI